MRSPPSGSRLVRPPTLLGVELLRRLLRPADFKRYVEPAIESMQAEYFDALSNGDEAGARWAIVRGHLYAALPILAAVITRAFRWRRI